MTDGNRSGEDWSIETGAVTTDECWSCGESCPDGRYCGQCRATGDAEAHKSVHAGYDSAGDGSAWETEPTPTTDTSTEPVRADGGQQRTDWRIVGWALALAAINAFVAALAIGVIGAVVQPGTAVLAIFGAAGCLVGAVLEVATNG